MSDLEDSTGVLGVGQASKTPIEFLSKKKVRTGCCLWTKPRVRVIMPVMRKQVLVLGIFLLLNYLATPMPAQAAGAVRCETFYGGQRCVPVGQLQINKKVFDPSSKTFLDNLLPSGHRFVSGEEVTFTIDIKNVSEVTVSNITFTDTLPLFLTWSGGDPLTSTIGSLAPGQTISKTIRAKVTAATGACAVNKAAAVSADSTDSDTAQVCAALPPEVPAAGPEVAVLTLLPGLGAVGWFLRKIAS